MKTIFISCFHPYTSRNILATDAFGLLAARNDMRIVLFVHAIKKDYIEKKFGSPHVIIEPIALDAPSKRLSTLVMKRIAKYCLGSNSVRIQRYMKWKFEKKYWFFLFSLASAALSRSRAARSTMRAIDYATAKKDRYKKYFDMYHPDAVVITDILNERDVEFAQNARFFSVPVIGMVRSWDNLTLHGFMRILPDQLLVAGPEIKKQAEHINDCPQNSVTITGIPHYDNYFKGAAISRSDFFTAMRLTDVQPLLLYAPIGDFYIANNTTDAYVVSLLASMDAQTIVRFSPTVPVNNMEIAAPQNQKVVFDRPGVNFVKGDIGNQELSPEDDARFLQELVFSDVIICGPSTVALDAISVDKPVIIINFHPDQRGYYDGIARRYDYDHFRFAISLGAFRVARSPEELRSLIAAYYADPLRDREQRKKLRDAYCGPIDGKSGERVAVAILSFIKSS